MLIQYQSLLQHIISSLGIEREQIVLLGGTALAAHGIRLNNDVDFTATQQVKETLLKMNLIKKEGGYLICEHVDLKIGWASILGFSDEEIITNPEYHTYHDGFKVVRLELVFAAKVIMARKHDQTDVKLIERNCGNFRTWDWELVRQCLANAEERRSPAPVKLPSGNAESRLLTVLNPRKLFKAAAKAVAKRVPREVAVKLEELTRADASRALEPVGLSGTPDTHVWMQSILQMPTGALLSLQNINGEFCRFDIMMRYLTAKTIDERRDDFEAPYCKMQKARIGQSDYEAFVKLVQSMRSGGFVSRYPIAITKEGRLLDGAHRLACALYFGVQEVPVWVRPSRQQIDYGKQWFIDQRFPTKLLRLMDESCDELFERTGVWFSVILWPACEPWHDEICNWVRARYCVKWQKTVDWGDKFQDVVRRIYETDDIAPWRVELKLHCLKPFGTKVRLLAIELADPSFRRKSTTSTYLSSEGEKIKKQIRESYKDRVANYFYDIICHTGDNHRHNQEIFAIIREMEKS